MRPRRGISVLGVMGVIALLLGLVVTAFGFVTMMHNAGNRALAQQNLARIQAESDELGRMPPSPQRNARITQLHDEFLNFGGMNAETEKNLTIGLVCLILGALVTLGGSIGLLIGLLRGKRPVMGATT